MNYEKRTFLGVEVVFASDLLRQVLARAERAAATGATILIYGESGTGKEVIARAVHHFSPRRDQPWVDINCAALPDTLLESELFGYEKGAFSGAQVSKPGLFDLAHRGTLLLDEIGDLDLSLQVKLLRILDGSPFYRLGGTRKVSVDVRLITATNRDLKAAAEAGEYRFDLYHRLSQVRLTVPPLRDRPEDVAPLAEHFLRGLNTELTISQDALLALQSYAWPGNVRELRNVITGAAVFANGAFITMADLPEEVAQPSFSSSLDSLSRLHTAERDVIAATLRETGSQRLAATRLGISRRTLQRRIQAYGLSRAQNLSSVEG